MLLMMDMLIEGSVREKIIISYYRYKGGNKIKKINEVCRICKSNGYLSPKFNNGVLKRPKNYPDIYFKRFLIESKLKF